MDLLGGLAESSDGNAIAHDLKTIPAGSATLFFHAGSITMNHQQGSSQRSFWQCRASTMAVQAAAGLRLGLAAGRLAGPNRDGRAGAAMRGQRQKCTRAHREFS